MQISRIYFVIFLSNFLYNNVCLFFFKFFIESLLDEASLRLCLPVNTLDGEYTGGGHFHRVTQPLKPVKTRIKKYIFGPLKLMRQNDLKKSIEKCI